MKILNISISDLEFDKFGIKKENLNFSELIDIVTKELSIQNISKCLELAEKNGLSKLTMENISNEVKTVRMDDKNRN